MIERDEAIALAADRAAQRILGRPSRWMADIIREEIGRSLLPDTEQPSSPTPTPGDRHVG